MAKTPKGGGGNSHQRAVEGASIKPTQSAKESKSKIWLNFIEQPLFTLPISILGGIVGVFFYYQAIFLCVGCILLAFHRAGVVAGQKRIAQICTYICLFLISTSMLLGAGYAIKKKTRDDLTHLAETVGAAANKKPPRRHLNGEQKRAIGEMADRLPKGISYSARLYSVSEDSQDYGEEILAVFHEHQIPAMRVIDEANTPPVGILISTVGSTPADISYLAGSAIERTFSQVQMPLRMTTRDPLQVTDVEIRVGIRVPYDD